MDTHMLKFLLFFLLFLSFFFFIYLLGYFIIFRKWTPMSRPQASSCFLSLFHGTPAAVFTATAILIAPNRSFAARNTSFQNLVLDYSAAYFAADLVHLTAFFASDEEDVLFLVHHLATLFVIITCRHVASHGAVAILALLTLAESTSVLQDAMMLARVRQKESQLAARVSSAQSVPFCLLYLVIRGFFGTFVVCRMVVFYLRGGAEGVIATWIWVSWVVVVSLAIVGSVVWVSFLGIEVYREKIEQSRGEN